MKIFVNGTFDVLHPGLYNLGTGDTRSFQQLAEMISETVEEIPFPEILRGKYQFYSKADTTNLRTLIGNYKFITPEEFYNDNFKRAD